MRLKTNEGNLRGKGSYLRIKDEFWIEKAGLKEWVANVPRNGNMGMDKLLGLLSDMDAEDECDCECDDNDSEEDCQCEGMCYCEDYCGGDYYCECDGDEDDSEEYCDCYEDCVCDDEDGHEQVQDNGQWQYTSQGGTRIYIHEGANVSVRYH